MELKVNIIVSTKDQTIEYIIINLGESNIFYKVRSIISYNKFTHTADRVIRELNKNPNDLQVARKSGCSYDSWNWGAFENYRRIVFPIKCFNLYKIRLSEEQKEKLWN